MPCLLDGGAYHPVSFSDPLGLCPEDQRDEKGYCPGGLSVDEWNAVKNSMQHMSDLGKQRIQTALDGGNIQPYASQGFRSLNGGVDHDRSARVTAEKPEIIQVNRNFREGSAFFQPSRELARDLLHESQHVVQFRVADNLDERKRLVGDFGDAFERAAAAFARINLVR